MGQPVTLMAVALLALPTTADANPFMSEWLQPMGLRGAITVTNVPLYQELARRAASPCSACATPCSACMTTTSRSAPT